MSSSDVASATTTPGRATPAMIPASAAVGRPVWVQRLLRVPLLQKLVTADVAINLLAFVVMRWAPAEYAVEIMVVSLVVTVALNAVLVVFALRPLSSLEATAMRVSHGDLDARVPPAPLADRNIARIGRALNELLDGLTADRQRMRELAAQVISAGDEERAHIARELHDSTAQSLSALDFMITALLRDPAAGPAHERLRVMHELVVEALAEVRTLSHNVHPRVLDDLGLAAALEFLARRTRETSGAAVHTSSDVRAAVPPAAASVVYRVAQEAVRNAVRHAQPSAVHMTLTADERVVRLLVSDDGPGFDVGRVTAERRGMGLFVMRERLALVSGSLDIESRPGGDGTRVRVEIPLREMVA